MVTDFIVFVSPVLASGMLWFIINHIKEVKDKISEVKGNVMSVQKEVHSLNLSVVKIQSDIDYLKDDSKIKSNLTVVKEMKK
jgi:peptidoglycan hydrolase CwlO-like protein